MIKGLYIARAGMFNNTKKLDVAANNLANINTSGFKKDKIFFNQLVNAQNAIKNNNVNQESSSAELNTDFSTGNLRQTDNPLDLAIVGEGFFEIQTPSGNAYTRNGNFAIDGENRLITQDGHAVMGSGGEIQISGNQIKISDDGSVTIDGEVVDKIRIISFEDPSFLIKIGSTLFSDEEEAGVEEVDPDNIQIRQGFLESSNVNGIDEVIEMIDLYRQFEISQKTIKTHDETLEKLINDTGRVG